MKRITLALFSAALAAVAPLGSAHADATPYALRYGDTLQVSVWKEDALQREVRVLPDGSITLPLAGRVEAAGLSSAEVEKRVADKLRPYIPDPVVSIVVTGIEGHRVYILGKVVKPGPVPLSAPDLTVLQALSQAGGLDKFADPNGVRVLRETPNGQQVLQVNVEKLLRGDNLPSNIRLQAGDTILVP